MSIIRETITGENFLQKIDTEGGANNINAVQLYEKYNGSNGASSNTIFTLAGEYVPSSNTLMVFVNGQKAEKVSVASNEMEYEETSKKIITFGDSLLDADVIEFIIAGAYKIDIPDLLTQFPSIQRTNEIINGNFNIWQRGTSFSSVATSTYSADRFVYSKNGTMVHDIIQDTDVPSSVNANYSLKIDCTTADATIDAANFCQLAYKIEGYDFLPLVGKTVTLSFWVKATKIGKYCISLGNNGADRSYISEYEVYVTDTWEKKTITIVLDYSGGTWNYTTGIGLQINWILAAGSAFQNTPDSWISANDKATTNQVNGVDNTDNNFWLSQIQLEVNDEATEFDHIKISEELEKCKRYFETLKNAGNVISIASGLSNLTTEALYTLLFSEKRVDATITFSGNTDFNVNQAGGDVQTTGIASGSEDKKSAVITATVAAGLTAGEGVLLSTQNTSAYINIDAEL